MVEYYYSTAERKSARQEKKSQMVAEIVALVEQKFNIRRDEKFEMHAEINSDYFHQIKDIMGKSSYKYISVN